MREEQDGFHVRVVDGAAAPWQKQRVLGRFLTRAEALADPGIDDVFHVTDHLVKDDPIIREYFRHADA
jgi:hypothetical protein